MTVVDPLLEIADLPPEVRLLNTLDFSLLLGTPERYVVVASRGKFDEEAVEQALHAQSAYVGWWRAAREARRYAAAWSAKASRRRN